MPKVLRSVNYEKRRNMENLHSMLDLKSKINKRDAYKTDVASVQREANERVNDSQQLQSNLRMKDFQQDVLPYVFHMIHPTVRAINTQLMEQSERNDLQTAIEIMVLFDIKLMA